MDSSEQNKTKKIGFFKKVWYSITKFERYPEMATEGVGSAFAYLAKLMLIFSAILVIGMIYNLNQTLQQGMKYVDENFEEINYKDGILQVKPVNDKVSKTESERGTMIIDTETEDSQVIQEYEKDIRSAKIGIVWLKNKVIIYNDGVEEGYYYNDTLSQFNISEFQKSDIMDLVSNNNIYIIYGLVGVLVTFAMYFIVTLIDILVLSAFGLITMYLTKIRIRYRAIFNMSVYALTLSVILKLLYVFLNMFIEFEIKYFDFMYSAIGYVCLVAAIFMIKSDLIKQQIELMKIMNEKKQEQEEEVQEEPEEKEEDEKKEKKKDKEEKPEVDDDSEHQGSEA